MSPTDGTNPMTADRPFRHIVSEANDRVRAMYGDAIGRQRTELTTPALVLDIGAAQRNIDLMATRIREMPAVIRPHVKAHKSPDLARRQMAAGAPGLCTATVWEAMVMFEAGIDDLFIVNNVVGHDKVSALAAMARQAKVRVAVDDLGNALDLSAAAVHAGSTLGVMIEVDTGMDRAGVDDASQAIALARRLVELPGIQYDGLTGYEGHCARTPDDDLRLERQQAAITMLADVADVLAESGLPATVLSAGGTGTWEWTAQDPRITEIQAGTYAVMDTVHGRMSPGFEHSLTVEATVVSRSPGRLVVDAGNKSLAGGDAAIVAGHPSLDVIRFDEEHGVFAVTGPCSLRIGDAVALVPGSSPGTVNWYDAYHVVDGDVVIDVWPIVPRGPGHAGLLSGSTPGSA